MDAKQLWDLKAQEIYHLIREKEIKLLSFDVFDTILWRSVPLPHDIFLLLGQELQQSGVLWPSMTAESFVKYRASAETRARQILEGTMRTAEVTLFEIYQSFPKGCLKSIGIREVMEKEIALEIKHTHFDYNLIKLAHWARLHGVTVICVSDTYLSKMALSRVLKQDVEKPEFIFDEIFTSSDHRTPKALQLFDHVKKAYPLLPHQCLHIGDNFDADIVPTEERKWYNYHWHVHQKGFQSILDQEVSRYWCKRIPALNLEDGDAGITSLRKRVVHHKSLSVETEDMRQAFFERYGASFLGPVITLFNDWVVKRCQEEGYTDLFCLMREGRLFKKIIDTLGGGLQAHELFVSRFALTKTMIGFAKRDELEDFILRPNPLTVEEALIQLGVDPKDFPEGEVGLAHLIDNQIVLDNVCYWIMAQDKIRNQIIHHSREARKAFMAHLNTLMGEKQLNILPIIDLGYAGTIQRHLKKVFELEGKQIKTHGFYLLTNYKIEAIHVSGDYVEGYLSHAGEPVSVSHLITRAPEIIEQSVMADCGTTLGYAADGTPILGEHLVGEIQQKDILDAQRGILAFADIWRHHNQHISLNKASIKTYLAHILTRMIGAPSKIEVEFLGSWHHDENFGSQDTRSLIAFKDKEHDLGFMTAHQIASLSPQQLYWPFGKAHAMHPSLGTALYHIFMRDVSPEHFNAPEEQTKMLVFFNTGQDLKEEECVIVPYDRSSLSRVRTRIVSELQKYALHAIVICPVRKGYLFKLDKMVVVVKRPLAAEETITLEGENALSELIYHGWQNLYKNTYLAEDDFASVLWIPPKHLSEARFTGSIQIDLYFTALPLESEDIGFEDELITEEEKTDTIRAVS